jgi:sec-independent protein translocase protein TatC
LYLTEEQFWRKFLTVLSVTWITSNFLIYYKLIPCIWDFFTDVNQNAGNGYSIPLHFEAKLNEYIVFINKTYFIFNLLIIFTTIISFYLIKFTNQNLKSIKFSRKFIYILIFIVAALITPPDIASQITIALPLLMVYETIIIYLLIKKEYKNMVK